MVVLEMFLQDQPQVIRPVFLSDCCSGSLLFRDVESALSGCSVFDLGALQFGTLFKVTVIPGSGLLGGSADKTPPLRNKGQSHVGQFRETGTCSLKLERESLGRHGTLAFGMKFPLRKHHEIKCS